MKDYDTWFTEKLEMLTKLNEGEKINWKGKHTQTIENLGHLSPSLSSCTVYMGSR
jgi:hypothetical protein